MKKLNLSFISLLILLILFQGCMPDSLTKFKKDEPKKATDLSLPTVNSPTSPPDLTTLAVFQLKNITQNSTSYHLHKYGVGNSVAKCEVPVTALGSGEEALIDQTNDILCWLEADEVQLYFNGGDFQLNAPAGYCEYIQVKPYYFWTAPPMNTQKIIKSVDCANTLSPNCVALGGVIESKIVCSGDYTSVGGPNCDEGYVTLNAYNVAEDNTYTLTTSTTACGGKRTNCYAGPGVDFGVDREGYPIATDYLAYTGLSIEYKVTAPGPTGKNYGSNYYISNFTSNFSSGVDAYLYDYTSIGSITGMSRFSQVSQVGQYTYLTAGEPNYDNNAGVAAGDTAVVDGGLDPLKRANSTLIKTGPLLWTTGVRNYPVNPFYEFSCLNYAHETKARIRLQIREWNQIFRTPVASYTEVSEASPLRMLKHSANSTDYETSGVGYWNDVKAWDIPYAYGSTVGAIPATNNDITQYGFLFPYLGF